MEILNFIIPFLVLITVVVFIHEYGHYYSAKYFEKYSKNSEYKNFYGSPDDSEESSFDGYSDPIVIAKVIEKAISAKNPKTRYSAGAYSWILLTMRSILPDKWFDSFIVKVIG